MYQRLVKNASIIGILIFVVNLLANRFYWYTTIFGFDKFMHTLGGAFIIFIIASVYIKELRELRPWQIFVVLTLGAFVVGLIWEYYEYLVQAFVKTVHLADIPDSIGDLIFDVLGGSIGSFFVILINKRYNRQDND